jgi:hypothetical protein
MIAALMAHTLVGWGSEETSGNDDGTDSNYENRNSDETEESSKSSETGEQYARRHRGDSLAASAAKCEKWEMLKERSVCRAYETKKRKGGTKGNQKKELSTPAGTCLPKNCPSQNHPEKTETIQQSEKQGGTSESSKRPTSNMSDSMLLNLAQILAVPCPLPGQPGAPLFDGKDVTVFLRNWGRFSSKYRFPDDRKLADVVDYCEPNIGKYIEILIKVTSRISGCNSRV